MRSDKNLFGVVNCVYYNRKPQGDLTLFFTIKQRDVALSKLRQEAISNGLSRDSAMSGIYPLEPRTVQYFRAKGHVIPQQD